MIVLDTNLLIYAVNQDAQLHLKAKTWLEATMSGSETVGLSWHVILAFLRLTTRHGLFSRPIAVRSAFDLIESWLEQPSVITIHPGPGHVQVLREFLESLGAGGNLTSDAHLAALAIENQAELCSADNDFGRFPRLRWRNPLL
jgi:toxin-antitoxin system PIN domain toxin